MKKIKNFIKKNWISVWLVVAVVLFGSGIVLAKYGVTHNIVKRVIATDSGAGNRFTSDYLTTGNSGQHIRNVSATSENDIVFDIHIYNYSVNKPTQWYPIDLDYTLTAQIKSLDGTSNLTSAQVESLIGDDEIILYSVTTNGSNQETLSAIATLDKDNLSEQGISQTIVNSTGGGTFNTYKLVLPNSVIGENISVALTATPASKHRDIEDVVLSSRFGASVQTIVLSTGWTGAFNDDMQVSLANYEGFNYSITGSGNSSGKLSWRYDLIEPNTMEILELFGVDITDSNNYSDIEETHMRTITLANLSSDQNAGRYDFQIYIIDKAAKEQIETLNNWTTFSSYCVFEEDE